jgi:hypothetical protein
MRELAPVPSPISSIFFQLHGAATVTLLHTATIVSLLHAASAVPKLSTTLMSLF